MIVCSSSVMAVRSPREGAAGGELYGGGLSWPPSRYRLKSGIRCPPAPPARRRRRAGDAGDDRPALAPRRPPPPALQVVSLFPNRGLPVSTCASPTAPRWCRASSRATGPWCSSASPIAPTSARPPWRRWRRRRSSGGRCPTAPGRGCCSCRWTRTATRPTASANTRTASTPTPCRHRRRPGAGSVREIAVAGVRQMPPPEGARRPVRRRSFGRDRGARSAGAHGRRDPAAARSGRHRRRTWRR